MSAEDHQRHYTAATDEGAIIAVVDFESGHEIELEVQLTPEQAEAVWKSGPAFVELSNEQWVALAQAVEPVAQRTSTNGRRSGRRISPHWSPCRTTRSVKAAVAHLASKTA